MSAVEKTGVGSKPPLMNDGAGEGSGLVVKEHLVCMMEALLPLLTESAGGGSGLVLSGLDVVLLRLKEFTAASLDEDVPVVKSSTAGLTKGNALVEVAVVVIPLVVIPLVVIPLVVIPLLAT